MKDEIYEDSDIEDYPKEIAPNLIHRFGYAFLIGMCIAFAIVVASVFLLGNVME